MTSETPTEDPGPQPEPPRPVTGIASFIPFRLVGNWTVNWVLTVVITLGVIGAAVAAWPKNETKTDDGPGQTVCQLIANPAYDNLDAGDVAHLAKMSTESLRNYVHRNCPAYDFRVD